MYDIFIQGKLSQKAVTSKWAAKMERAMIQPTQDSSPVIKSNMQLFFICNSPRETGSSCEY